MNIQFLSFFFVYLEFHLIVLHSASLLQSLPVNGDYQENELYKLLQNKIALVVSSALDIAQGSISPACADAVSYAYLNRDGNVNYSFFNKLMKESSRNKNDVGHYHECENSKLSDSDVSSGKVAYLIVKIERNSHKNLNTTLYETNSYMIGLCVASGCTDEEYRRLAWSINLILDNFFEIDSIDDLFVFTMHNKKYSGFKCKYIFYLLPLYLLVLQILISCSSEFRILLFKNFFRNKADSDCKDDLEKEKEKDTIKANQLNINSSTSEISQPTKGLINQKKLFKFTSCFNLSQNGEELFNMKETVSEFHNETGLPYIKGIRGTSMIFLVFGLLYFNLYISPIKIYAEGSYIDMIKSPLFGILFFGLRFAPRILFSCSGFCLVYKLLCFLDEQLESEFDDNLQQSASSTDTLENWNNTLPQIYTLDSSESILDHTTGTGFPRDSKEISYFSLLRFYLYQAHKYFILIFVLCFFKYSLYYSLIMLHEAGPIFLFFKIKIMNKVKFYDWMLHLFLFTNFEVFEQQEKCLINMFWMVFNESAFFIITSIIIFFAFKKKFKIDMIFIIIIPSLLVLRFLVVNLSSKTYSTLYSYLFEYGRLSVNYIYNFPCYLIGALFGILNYTVQKGMSFKLAKKQEKPYLISSIAILNFFKGQTRCWLYLTGGIGIGLIVLLSVSQPLFLAIAKERDEHLNYYFVNNLMNNLYLLDTELVVILTHYIGFVYYIKGDNLVHGLLSNNCWIIFSKLYYGYILCINPVMSYIFYQSETRIKLDLTNVMLFTVIAGLILFIIAGMLYIFFELPCKRISRTIFHKGGN